jgi:PTH1 family peptidyl-tRNA hydrolase
MSYRLIIGLGNPGDRYRGTRHNIGFEILDRLAKRKEFSFRREDRGPVEAGQGEGVWWIKPLTYMNLSGEAVRLWLDWLKLDRSELLVVVDDINLPLGQLRLREGGSHGGHNGLRSIEESLGSTEYSRVRCGVGGQPDGKPLEAYVLERFLRAEAERVQSLVDQAADAVQCCQSEGIGVAMTRYNQKLREE